jgi:light-regulated signal transduction histidine kinase (bacteriophytochrome)
MNEIFNIAKENIELKKEVQALRRALKSHGEIIEMNHALKEEVKLLKNWVDILKAKQEAVDDKKRAFISEIAHI